MCHVRTQHLVKLGHEPWAGRPFDSDLCGSRAARTSIHWHELAAAGRQETSDLPLTLSVSAQGTSGSQYCKMWTNEPTRLPKQLQAAAWKRIKLFETKLSGNSTPCCTSLTGWSLHPSWQESSPRCWVSQTPCCTAALTQTREIHRRAEVVCVGMFPSCGECRNNKDKNVKLVSITVDLMTHNPPFSSLYLLWNSFLTFLSPVRLHYTQSGKEKLCIKT